jgi:hypothetical protein
MYSKDVQSLMLRFHEPNASWISFTMDSHTVSMGNPNPETCTFLMCMVGLNFLPSLRQSVRQGTYLLRTPLGLTNT